MRASTAILLSLAVLLLFAAFVHASRGAGARGRGQSGNLSWWDESTEHFVRSKVARAYVDSVDPRRGREAFFRAMSEYVHFDRYSRVIGPTEYSTWSDETRGRYAGLGIKVDRVEDGLLLLGVWPGGPAARAGVLVGETLVAADGTPLNNEAAEDVTRLLKGPAQSTVTLTVVAGPRPESGPALGPRRHVVLTRDVIRPPTIYSRRIGAAGDIGVMRLTDFTNETAHEIERHLKGLLQHKLRGLVLDLRHNGGGVLGVATGLVDRFLDRGTIVRMEGRTRDAQRATHASAAASDLLHLPLVVLVDGRSASASEIVAGALQDHRRAVVLGTRTYGKFLVQSIIPIPGRHAAIKLTTSRYYLPSGRSYEASPDDASGAGLDGAREPAGLLPDVVVALDEPQTTRLLQQWSNEEGRPWGETARYPEVPAAEMDPQLAHAAALLEGGHAHRRMKRRPAAPSLR